MENLYDAHQHFHFEALKPHRSAIVKDLRAIGLRRAVVNATNEVEWRVVANLARLHPWMLPSFGLHPWDCGNRSPDWLEILHSALVAEPRAGVGEIGLDRWIIDSLKPDDPRLGGLRVAPLEEQTEVFEAQLKLAAKLNRPASIHCVQAWGALYAVVVKAKLPARGFLLHGYAGPAEMIKNFTDLGAYFSFNIQMLEPRHATRLNNFRHIPAKRLLVETDAPAKPPAPDKNRFPLPPEADGTAVNHPANIAAAYAALAELRGIPLETLATQVEENFQKLFV